MIRTAAFLCAAVLVLPSPQTPHTSPPRTLDALVTDLASTDPEARVRAACGLRRRSDRPAVPLEPLLRLLDDASPVDATACGNRSWGMGPDNLTTPGGEAAVTLASLGSRAVDPLMDALQSSSWLVRRNATWALGRLRDTRARDALLRMLQDPDARVRRHAAWALGSLDK